MQLFFIFACYHITSSTALTTPNVASIPSGNNLVPPPPAVGESVHQWLDQLFGPSDNSSSNSTNITLSARSSDYAKRDTAYIGDYREYNGIHELSWDNETTETTFNLTMDLSESCIGLNYSSEIGLYTFANGTTAARTQLKDIISDIWALAPTTTDRRRRWANHTIVVAQMALSEADEVLNSALICQNDMSTAVSAKAATGNLNVNTVHDELRHLLSASAWSYWTATVISTMVGAAIGAAFAAGVQQHFSGNITAQNVVQTAAVVGATVLIGGILMRLHENGRIDRMAQVATNRAMLGRQAVVQHTHIARWREAFAEVRRHSNERNWDSTASRDATGFSVDGHSKPGSFAGISASGKGTPRSTPRGNSDHFMCLSDLEAVDALRALGQMSSDDMRLKMMATIHEYEMERMANGEAGPSNRDDWSVCPPRESLESGPSESAEPSFRTAKGGPGEASAADLVEVENVASGSGGGWTTDRTAANAGKEAANSGSATGGGTEGGKGAQGAQGGGGAQAGGGADEKGKGKATDGG